MDIQEIKSLLSDKITKYRRQEEKIADDYVANGIDIFSAFVKAQKDMLKTPLSKEIDELLAKQVNLEELGKLTKVHKSATVYTIENFKNNVKCGGFIDYDGSGELMISSTMTTEITILPSILMYMMNNDIPLRNDVTHVCWYNR